MRRMENISRDGDKYLYECLYDGDKRDAEEPLSHKWAKNILYDLGITSWLHIPALAQLWLEELKNVGLQEIDHVSGAPPKRSFDDEYDPLAGPPSGAPRRPG